MSQTLPAIGDQSFESLKQANQHGAEFWSARDLQPLLGYTQWRRFEGAIQKAITSCEQSGNESAHHFASAGKMVQVGSGSQREVPDFQLSRFACYLIAQNGDPRKPEIALAQKYFAIQTRRQELSDQQAADLERLELRKQASMNTSQQFQSRLKMRGTSESSRAIIPIGLTINSSIPMLRTTFEERRFTRGACHATGQALMHQRRGGFDAVA